MKLNECKCHLMVSGYKFYKYRKCKINESSIVAKYLRTLSSLFSPNLIDQSSCRIMTTHTKSRPILHDDWSIRLGENRPDSVLKHLAAMLTRAQKKANGCDF